MSTESHHSAEGVPRLIITPGQRKYLRMVGLYGDVGDQKSWWASVRHGYRQYRAHRAAVKELGDWVPYHQRHNDGSAAP